MMKVVPKVMIVVAPAVTRDGQRVAAKDPIQGLRKLHSSLEALPKVWNLFMSFISCLISSTILQATSFILFPIKQKV